jgi:hypothetical protein
MSDGVDQQHSLPTVIHVRSRKSRESPKSRESHNNNSKRGVSNSSTMQTDVPKANETVDINANKKKGYFIGPMDAFLPSIDSSGHVLNSNSNNVASQVDSTTLLSTDMTSATGNTLLSTNTNMPPVVTDSTTDNSTNNLLLSSSNINATDFVSNNSTNNTASQNNNHRESKKREEEKEEIQEQREHIRFNRTRQVRILAFFIAILIALLALFGLLFLRFWSQTNLRAPSAKVLALREKVKSSSTAQPEAPEPSSSVV